MLFKSLKLIKIIFIFFAISVFFLVILSQGKVYDRSELSYGITFSKKHAQELGIDWKEAYLSALDDLGAKKVRIPAYWDEVEEENGYFKYADLDWQIEEAKKRNVRVILAIGGRLPRWPECHFPGWTENMSKENIRKEIFEYLSRVSNRYKKYSNIYAWQIENEYFLKKFGECPDLGNDFLDAEIRLVRGIDPKRPIIITDSGELSLWVPAAKRADIFGTSIYLNTYSQTLKSYVHYPITPAFFHFKKNITSLFADPEDWIVIELQAEPWGPIPYQFMSEKDKSKTMDLEKFRHIIEFSHQAGFKEFYLWGVEWWWWEKEKNNNSALWEEAKKLFKPQY
ncbi:cellulase family glycosylhydrolase [Candidatus Falkowbacteria bacterium]|nr:cellulase family glycosylhydrolase [Candidatus Falkowbacteria bacterium]